MRLILTAALVFAGATAAVAQEVPVAPPASPEPPKEKKVCRSEPQLGSIMTKRTCHTRAEWKSIDEQNRVNAERIRDSQPGGAPRG